MGLWGCSPRSRICSVVTHPYSISDAGICLCCTDCSVHSQRVGSEAKACGSSTWCLSWTNPKAFQPTFPPFLLFFRSMCSRLLPIQPFLLCCPSLAASVLPLFFHVGMMCVMYICMVLYSSLPKVSLAFPFLLALHLIFCLAYLITLPVSNLFSCPWSRYPYILQTTQMDIQVLLHPHFRPFCHWNKPQI